MPTEKKKFKVHVNEWDNEQDGNYADLSNLKSDFIVSLKVYGDEDQADIESRIMDKISEETGWAILDCTITPIN